MAIENDPISESLLREIVYHITDALQYLHQQRICHLDVKPDNILFLDSGHRTDSVVLADFGLARQLTGDLCTEEPCGSIHYAAPELVQGGPFTKAVDMWALGITMYACLTGKFPYDATNRSAMIHEIISGLPQLFRDDALPPISDDGKCLIRSLLQVNPEERLTAGQMLQHIWFGPVRCATGEANGSPPDEAPLPIKDSSPDTESLCFPGHPPESACLNVLF